MFFLDRHSRRFFIIIFLSLVHQLTTHFLKNTPKIYISSIVLLAPFLKRVELAAWLLGLHDGMSELIQDEVGNRGAAARNAPRLVHSSERGDKTTRQIALTIVQLDGRGAGLSRSGTAGTLTLVELCLSPGLNLGILVDGGLHLEEGRCGLGVDQSYAGGEAQDHVE